MKSLFKLWHKEVKCWIKCNPCVFQDGQIGRWNSNIPFDFFKSDEIEIVRSSGIKDKNEKEIYEGDIVEIGDFIYSIKFEIGSFMLVRCSDKTDMYAEFDNCWNDDVYPLSQLHWESNAEEDILYNCEIIGNIYENPELLKSEVKSNE